MNAAVTIFLIKGWAETIYVKVTASPYNVSVPQVAQACVHRDSLSRYSNL
jgi:hypothetical protein